MPLNVFDANKAIELYTELRDLRSARDVAEGYYGTATIVVSNTVTNKKVEVDKQVALDAIGALIAGVEAKLTALGFDPDA